eukprot:1188401-Prorocentrum_minimum.AAC.9
MLLEAALMPRPPFTRAHAWGLLCLAAERVNGLPSCYSETILIRFAAKDSVGVIESRDAPRA